MTITDQELIHGQDVSARLPAPYDRASFVHLRKGIFDSPTTDVFIDDERTFAFLDPRPVMDYVAYVPRSQSLQLVNYKRRLDTIEHRFEKISDLFRDRKSILEIGAADGAFLAKLKGRYPSLSLHSVEPDQRTSSSRSSLALSSDHHSIEDAARAGIVVDTVCMFHVFEHLAEPDAMLDRIAKVLAPNGRLIIEVPSLTDPLLWLYKCAPYAAFYFQKQHPFVYSATSLRSVLQAAQWQVLETRPSQRYGLSNHLAWLVNGKPGGDESLESVVGSIDDQYRLQLEKTGQTDTIFAIATA